MVLPSGWDSLWTALKVISLARSYLQPDNLVALLEGVHETPVDLRTSALSWLTRKIGTTGGLSGPFGTLTPQD